MVQRDDVTRTLHRLAHAAYFGQATWPASRETNEALHAMMLEAKLIRMIDDRGSFVSEPGVAAELDLLLYVIGHNDPGDFPELTVDDWHELEQLGSWEACLAAIKPRIFAAYERRFIASGARQ
jgi:hypothetical protein